MTDAQYQAYRQTRKNLTDMQSRILAIICNRPGSTLDEIRAGYQNEHGKPLPEKTASGRVSELAKAGIIYVNGKKKVGTRTLSRYYYEPDPENRFTYRQARADEDFHRAVNRLSKFSDRLPGFVRGWVEEVNQ